jgi:hypothetical protein
VQETKKQVPILVSRLKYFTDYPSAQRRNRRSKSKRGAAPASVALLLEGSSTLGLALYSVDGFAARRHILQHHCWHPILSWQLSCQTLPVLLRLLAHHQMQLEDYTVLQCPDASVESVACAGTTLESVIILVDVSPQFWRTSTSLS